MANVNAPFGFLPRRHLHGDRIIVNGGYVIASGLAATIREGDPVKLTGSGRNITLADAGDTAVGIFHGCKYVNATNDWKMAQQFLTGTTTFDGSDVQCWVWDDPQIVFGCQCDTLAAGDIGALVDWNAGTGSSVTGKSGAYADIGATTATTGKGLRLLGLIDAPDNAYGAYAKAEVAFAEHTLLGISAGAAGV